MCREIRPLSASFLRAATFDELQTRVIGAATDEDSSKLRITVRINVWPRRRRD
jgi:hypothetical protein